MSHFGHKSQNGCVETKSRPRKYQPAQGKYELKQMDLIKARVSEICSGKEGFEDDEWILE